MMETSQPNTGRRQRPFPGTCWPGTEERQTDRQTGTDRDRHTDTHTDIDTQTDRHRHTDRQRQTQTERDVSRDVVEYFGHGEL